jgi:3D (Asp-Asp-Asp) domain-containing protein
MKNIRKILRKKVKTEKIVVVIFATLYIWPWVFPQHVAYAATGTLSENIVVEENIQTVLIDKGEPDEIRWVTMTGYSSTPDQTDDTPFITANQTHVRWGIGASNFLSFNSQIQVPEYFDDETFIITDRMHSRFSDRIDIWFPTREEAMAFGKRRLQVEIWYY